jgi:hypothetical protein
MLKRLLVTTGMFTLAFGLGVGAYAQSGSAASAKAAGTDNKINVEGCLFPQKAMTADASAASSGKMDQYILTDYQIVSASPGVNQSPDQVFKLTQVDEARLRELSGKKVLVLAHVAGTDQSPELQVISIIHSEGFCAAAPKSHS